MTDLNGDLKSALAGHGFLEGLQEAHLVRLAGLATLRRCASGEYLFKTGEPATHCYLIQSGHVNVQVHDPARGDLILESVGEHKVLGWSWLVPPYRWSFDGRAVEPTEVVAIDSAGLRDACDRDHELGYQLLKRFTEVFSQRLHAARILLLDIYGPGG